MEEGPREQLDLPYTEQAGEEARGKGKKAVKEGPEQEYPIEVADFGQILKVAFDNLEERLSGLKKELFVRERRRLWDRAMELFNGQDTNQSPTNRMMRVFNEFKSILREENQALANWAKTDKDERLEREAKAWEDIIVKLWAELMLSYSKLTGERRRGREKPTGTSAPVIPLRSDGQKAEK